MSRGKLVCDPHIGANIRRIREQQGLSVQDLAKIMGVQPRIVRQWESGEVQPQPYCTLWRMSRLLGMPMNEFYEDEDAADEDEA